MRVGRVFPVWCADRALSPETHSSLLSELRPIASLACTPNSHLNRVPSDAEVWALVAFAMLNSRSDALTKGLDEATGYIVTVLFLITAVPPLR